MVPYIYSIDEIKRLLRAADERLEEDCLIRPKTFRTLLLLLYGSGLRISEALALNVGDVDLEERVLTIRETKFYKSRLVPIGDDLHGLLLRYGEHQHPAKSSGDRPFLADRHGNRIPRQRAELGFKRIREYIGLRRPPEFKFHPRLHDLRHTFAVNRLVSWYKEGKNDRAASQEPPVFPERTLLGRYSSTFGNFRPPRCVGNWWKACLPPIPRFFDSLPLADVLGDPVRRGGGVARRRRGCRRQRGGCRTNGTGCCDSGAGRAPTGDGAFQAKIKAGATIGELVNVDEVFRNAFSYQNRAVERG